VTTRKPFSSRPLDRIYFLFFLVSKPISSPFYRTNGCHNLHRSTSPQLSYSTARPSTPHGPYPLFSSPFPICTWTSPRTPSSRTCWGILRVTLRGSGLYYISSCEYKPSYTSCRDSRMFFGLSSSTPTYTAFSSCLCSFSEHSKSGKVCSHTLSFMDSIRVPACRFI